MKATSSAMRLGNPVLRHAIVGMLVAISWVAGTIPGKAIGEGTPSAVGSINAVACTVPAITDDVLRSALQPRGHGTPEVKNESLVRTATAFAASALPDGQPVDSTIVDEVTALEMEFAACYNAGEMRRVAALLTGEGQRQFLSYADPSSSSPFGSRFATPSPLPFDQQIPFVEVSHVRRYSDGTVGALVTWDEDPSWRTASPSHVHFYVEVDGAWRIVAEVPVK